MGILERLGLRKVATAAAPSLGGKVVRVALADLSVGTDRGGVGERRCARVEDTVRSDAGEVRLRRIGRTQDPEDFEKNRHGGFGYPGLKRG